MDGSAIKRYPVEAEPQGKAWKREMVFEVSQMVVVFCLQSGIDMSTRRSYEGEPLHCPLPVPDRALTMMSLCGVCRR